MDIQINFISTKKKLPIILKDEDNDRIAIALNATCFPVADQFYHIEWREIVKDKLIISAKKMKHEKPLVLTGRNTFYWFLATTRLLDQYYWKQIDVQGVVRKLYHRNYTGKLRMGS